MKVQIAGRLERLTKSTAARCVMFVLAFVFCVWQSYNYFGLKSEHIELRTELPPNHNIVNLGDDIAVDSFIGIKYGKDVLVQEVGSYDVYQKLFSKEHKHEHVAFVGADGIGLVTTDRGIVWVHKKWSGAHGGLSPRFIVEDNVLVVNLTLKPMLLAQVFGYVIWPLFVYMGLLTVVNLWWSRILPLIRRIRPSRGTVSAI